MNWNFLNECKVDVVLGTQADGTGTQSSSIIDMSGYEDVTFLAIFADVDDTAVLTLRAQQDDVNDAGGMATLTGSATFTAGATNADNGMLALEKRYLRAQVVIATASAITAAVIAIRTKPRKSPVSKAGFLDTTSIILHSPDE